MLLIYRYFDISNAKRDLKYEPIYSYEDAWGITMDWFEKEWMPKHAPDVEVPKSSKSKRGAKRRKQRTGLPCAFTFAFAQYVMP